MQHHEKYAFYPPPKKDALHCKAPHKQISLLTAAVVAALAVLSGSTFAEPLGTITQDTVINGPHNETSDVTGAQGTENLTVTGNFALWKKGETEPKLSNLDTVKVGGNLSPTNAVVTDIKAFKVTGNSYISNTRFEAGSLTTGGLSITGTSSVSLAELTASSTVTIGSSDDASSNATLFMASGNLTGVSGKFQMVSGTVATSDNMLTFNTLEYSGGTLGKASAVGLTTEPIDVQVNENLTVKSGEFSVKNLSASTVHNQGNIKTTEDLTLTGTYHAQGESSMTTVGGNLEIAGGVSNNTSTTTSEAHKLTVAGNATINGQLSGNFGITVGTEGKDDTGSLTVAGFMGTSGSIKATNVTATGMSFGELNGSLEADTFILGGMTWVDNGGDSNWNVDKIVMKDSAGSDLSTITLHFQNGNYNIGDVSFEDEKTSAITLITTEENTSTSVTAGTVTVAEGKNGSLSFYDNKGSNALSATITKLDVGTNARFGISAVAEENHDPGNTELTITNAVLKDGSSLVIRPSGEGVMARPVTMTVSNMTTEGSSLFSTADTSKVTINEFSDATDGSAKTTWNLAHGSSVTTQKADISGSLDVYLEKLNTESESVPTAIFNDIQKGGPVSVHVPGSENTAAPDIMAERVDHTVVMNTVEDGKAVTYENGRTYIGEGALWDALTVRADGSYTTDKANSKLEGFKGVNAAALVQWRDQVNHLTKRLGDVRQQPSGIGAWARVYGGESKWGSSSNSVDMTSTTVQVGGDGRIGDWIVGGAFSYSDSDMDLDKGSGNGDLYGLAIYGSRLFDSGAYIDIVARYGRIKNDVNSSGMEFSTQNNAFGITVESGHQFKFMERAYIEPQIELSYGYAIGDNDSATTRIDGTSYHVKIDQDDYQTLAARIGFRTGFDFPEDAGTIYAHASYSYDFLGDADGTASVAGQGRRSLDQDLGGSWFTYGIGTQFRIGQRTFAYGELERTSGGEVENPYLFNVGLRHVF